MDPTKYTDPDKPKPPRFYREPHLSFNQSVALIIIFAIITGLLVNFLDKIHYSNLLSQADGQAGLAQEELGKEQYDVKFLINNNSMPINCFDLRSDFARSLCTTHNSSIKSSAP